MSGAITGSESPISPSTPWVTLSSSSCRIRGRWSGAGQSLGEVESTKSVSEIYAPEGCIVSGQRRTLADQPELVNSDPYGAGWLVEIEVSRGRQRRSSPGCRAVPRAEHQALTPEVSTGSPAISLRPDDLR